jgi:8-oxo-dGTP diphosphatase
VPEPARIEAEGWCTDDEAGVSGMAAQLSSAAGSDDRIEFAQKAFVVNDGCLLMVRKAESDPMHPGLWEVPGGRLERGEDLDEHIRREVWEETGVTIEPGPPFQMWQWVMPAESTNGTAGQIWVIAVARRCAAKTVKLVNRHREPGDHLAEMGWIPLAQIDRYEIIPDLQPAMRDFLAAFPFAGDGASSGDGEA